MNDFVENRTDFHEQDYYCSDRHIPGPYCSHFSSGVTIPNPAGPHMVDRGTTPDMRVSCDISWACPDE